MTLAKPFLQLCDTIREVLDLHLSLVLKLEKKTQRTLGQSIFSNSEECFPIGLIISLVCPSFPRPHRVLLHCLHPVDPFPL